MYWNQRAKVRPPKSEVDRDALASRISISEKSTKQETHIKRVSKGSTWCVHEMAHTYCNILYVLLNISSTQ